MRDGTLTRTEFIDAVSPIRETVSALVQQAADYQIGSREKTPLAKTVRTCRQLLKVEPALWLFVTVEGLDWNTSVRRSLLLAGGQSAPSLLAETAALTREPLSGCLTVVIA